MIEAYIDNNWHLVYRMNVDGSDLRRIGQIPRGYGAGSVPAKTGG